MQQTLNNSLNLKIFFFVIGLYFFGVLFIPESVFYLTVLMIGATLGYVVLTKKFIIKISFSFFLFSCYTLISFMGLFYGQVGSLGANQFQLIIFCMYFIFIVLTSTYNWQNHLYNIIVFICLIALIGTVVQLINPNLVSRFHQLLLTPQGYLEALSFLYNDVLIGFNYNPASSGFALSILVYYFFVKLFNPNSKSNFINIIMFLLAYALLFLTNKRGFVLFSVCIMAFILWNNSRNKLKAFLAILVVGILFTFMLFKTELGQDMILRTLQQDDITTGRSKIYRIMWQDFLNHPFFGNGTYTTNNVIPIHNGHNIYFQVLRENGIIGFLFFVSFLMYNLFISVVGIKRTNSLENKFQLEFSIALQLLFILWGMTGNPLYDVHALLIYILASSVSVSLYSKIKSEKYQREKNSNEF